MSKAYQSQSIFFAFGVLCTLTVYDGNGPGGGTPLAKPDGN